MFLSFLVAFGRFAHIFYMKGNSDPEVDSCPALPFCRLEKCAQMMLQLLS